MQVLDGPIGERGIIVEVFVAPTDFSQDAAPLAMQVETGLAVLDTGAMRTAVTRRLASRLSLRSRGRIPVQTPGGPSMRDLHNFRLGFAIPQPEASVATPYFLAEVVQGMNWEDHPYLDVLIGMDLLRLCDLTLRRSGTWSLTLP